MVKNSNTNTCPIIFFLNFHNSLQSLMQYELLGCLPSTFLESSYVIDLVKVKKIILAKGCPSQEKIEC